MQLDSTFASSLGFDVHSNYAAYKDRLPAALLQLQATGVNKGWLRDNNPRGAAVLRNAGWPGKVVTVVGNPSDAQIALDSGTDAIDPINEPKLGTPAEGAAARDLFNAIADKVNGKVPVLAPSIANITDTKAANLARLPAARGRNVHFYRGMRPLSEFSAQAKLAHARAGINAPHLPGWTTETGWHSYLVPGMTREYVGKENSNHRYTDPQLAASQLIESTLALFAAGSEIVIYYELLDQWRYRKVDGDADHEGYFGFLNDDLTPKPVMNVLRSWLAQVGGLSMRAALDLQQSAASMAGQYLAMQGAVATAREALAPYDVVA